jgi:hypothetical protein
MAKSKTKPTPKRPPKKSPKHTASKPTVASPKPGLRASLTDKALKARWEHAITRYRAAKSKETKSWDEEYEALGDILESDPPFYLAGGYKNVTAFLAVELPGVDERTAKRNIRVARHFDPADEQKHGVTKLDALLDYFESETGAPAIPAKIHLDRQKVKVLRGKRSVSLPFADVSINDLRAAARKAKSGGKTSTFEPPAIKALRAKLAAAKLSMVSVGLRNGVLSFGNVPFGRASEFGHAVIAAKLE